MPALSPPTPSGRPHALWIECLDYSTRGRVARRDVNVGATCRHHASGSTVLASSAASRVLLASISDDQATEHLDGEPPRRHLGRRAPTAVTALVTVRRVGHPEVVFPVPSHLMTGLDQQIALPCLLGMRRPTARPNPILISDPVRRLLDRLGPGPTMLQIAA